MPTLSFDSTSAVAAQSTEILDGSNRSGLPAAQPPVERLAPGCYLIVDAGETPRVHALTQAVTRIGRGLAADLRLDEHTVSARHVIIARRPTGVRLLDDRSTNGTFVNGRRTDQADLVSGDVIVVGRVVLSYLEVS
jgi:hypothetical protein